MTTNIRATRGRPAMHIPLPPTFDASTAADEDFLTPPIWVAMNPPSLFERPEMKRTASEVSSSWGGDDDESVTESVVSSEHPEESAEYVHKVY